MYIAKVLGKVVSIIKHPHYEQRVLLLVQQLDLEGNLMGSSKIAVDYVGAGEGDTVLVGSGPGTADEVFGLERAPMRELVMGIVDHFDVKEGKLCGNF